ncbi:MAG: carboxypeptidase regulatory-like domain-containing protein [Longimicrobiaceae bacterium]
MRRTILLLALLLAALPRALAAQGVTGTVVDAQSGEPVPGALVSLVTSDGVTRARVLADRAGRFSVRAGAAGRYVLRAERVGYAAANSPTLDLAAGETMTYRLAAPAQRTQLAGIVASAGSDSRRCTVRPTAGEEAATLWDEARKALEAAVATRQQYPYRFRTERRVRMLDATTRAVRREEVRPEGVVDNPYVAISPQRLAQTGYVEKRGDTVFFHAPDAAVLLSDPFLESHCFRSRRADGDHRGMVGLAFEPVRGGQVADVEGVLWLDAGTAELREVEYRYKGGSQSPPVPDRAGGRVEFHRLPNGSWIVNRWRILMPLPEAVDAALASNANPIPTTQSAASRPAVAEEAGLVVEVRGRDGTPVEMVAFASITGVVFDSTRSRPLAGARVSLAGTADSTRTDAEGRFTLQHLVEGVYALAFDHPRLDSLHFVPDAALVTVVPPQQLRRDLAIPSVASILAAPCQVAEGSAVGAAVGRITDRAAGEPLSGVPLLATWEVPGSADPGRAAAVSDEGGGYRFCELPVGARVRIVARLEADSAVAQAEPRRGVPQLNDLALAAPAELVARRANEVRQRAHVVVRLVDEASSRPIAGAKVSLSGASREWTTNRSGEFSLDAAPGTYSVAFNHPVYGSGTARLTVNSRGTVQYALRLPRRTVTLEPLRVVAQRVYPGFFDPRARGRHLNIVMREEIERRAGSARDVGDLVRTIPALQVNEVRAMNSGGFVSEICITDRMAIPGQNDDPTVIPSTSSDPSSVGEPRAATRMTNPTKSSCDRGVAVALDDMLIGGNAAEFLATFPTTGIESIIYVKPTEAASRYGFLARNGIILIYTRGNGPTVRETP